MKKAFTIIELVLVIVVISIITALAFPKTDDYSVADASIKLKSHIRYAQHLSMVDDKFSIGDADWYKNRWQIVFTGNKYSVVSNNNTTYAKDTENNGREIKDIDLGAEYSVSVSFSGGCAGENIISFDNVGRPFVGDLSTSTSAYTAGKLLTTPCVITLSNPSQQDINITIMQESGYARSN